LQAEQVVPEAATRSQCASARLVPLVFEQLRCHPGTLDTRQVPPWLLQLSKDTSAEMLLWRLLSRPESSRPTGTQGSSSALRNATTFGVLQRKFTLKGGIPQSCAGGELDALHQCP